MAYSKKGQKAQKNTGSYYPFGLQQKGYNTNVSPNGNALAQQYKFNGKEENNALGYNMSEMDLRHYDPALGRWNVLDPVVHHSMSPYNAFDNNPVFWADPSGADAIETEDAYVFTGQDAQDAFETIKNSISNNNDNSESPDDIIFLNNDNEEIGRIVIPGHEDEYVQTGLDVRLPPSLQPNVEIGSGEADAVGVNFESSVTVGGGMHGGMGYIYFMRGYNRGELFKYYFHGGNVGGGVGIGASGYSSKYNRELGSDFGIHNFIGKYNGWTGGISFFGGSYSWSNIENTSDELWRNMNHPSTWTSSSLGVNYGGKAEVRWFAGESYGAEKVDF